MSIRGVMAGCPMHSEMLDFFPGVWHMVEQETTVFLTSDLKSALERAATASCRTEAELILEGIRRVTADYNAPEPKLPLFSTGDPMLSERVDEALAGFGEP